MKKVSRRAAELRRPKSKRSRRLLKGSVVGVVLVGLLGFAALRSEAFASTNASDASNKCAPWWGRWYCTPPRPPRPSQPPRNQPTGRPTTAPPTRPPASGNPSTPPGNPTSPANPPVATGSVFPATGALLGVYYGDGSAAQTDARIGVKPKIHLTYASFSEDW